jgi:hypothetical protein
MFAFKVLIFCIIYTFQYLCHAQTEFCKFLSESTCAYDAVITLL